MDDQRFDDLAKSLATGVSRRRILTGLVGGLLGGTLGRFGEATARCPRERPISCNGECVDLRTSPEHCGRCGRSCGDGQVCYAGRCATSCPRGFDACGGTCVRSCPQGQQPDPATCACVPEASISCPDCGACEACDAGIGCGGACEDPCTAALLCSQANQNAAFQQLNRYLLDQGFASTSDPEAIVLREAGVMLSSVLGIRFVRQATGEIAELHYGITDNGEVETFAIVLLGDVAQYALAVQGGHIEQIFPGFEAAAVSETNCNICSNLCPWGVGGLCAVAGVKFTGICLGVTIKLGGVGAIPCALGSFAACKMITDQGCGFGCGFFCCPSDSPLHCGDTCCSGCEVCVDGTTCRDGCTGPCEMCTADGCTSSCGNDPCLICDQANDTCVERDCDDGNPCTLDTCNSQTGCSNVPAFDGNSCTVAEGTGICLNGQCVVQGCTPGGTCVTDTDCCADNEICLTGLCTPAGACGQGITCDPPSTQPCGGDGSNCVCGATVEGGFGCGAPSCTNVTCQSNAECVMQFGPGSFCETTSCCGQSLCAAACGAVVTAEASGAGSRAGH